MILNEPQDYYTLQLLASLTFSSNNISDELVYFIPFGLRYDRKILQYSISQLKSISSKVLEGGSNTISELNNISPEKFNRKLFVVLYIVVCNNFFNCNTN